jgi:hypothetical protein
MPSGWKPSGSAITSGNACAGAAAIIAKLNTMSKKMRIERRLTV